VSLETCNNPGRGTLRIELRNGEETTDKRDKVSVNNDYQTLALEGVVNKGPLLTIAMALFGEGSFIQDRLTNPQAYTYREEDNRDRGNATCLNLTPMGLLLADDSITRECTSTSDGGVGVNSSALGREIADLTSIFFDHDIERLSNAFTAAAFLANKAWMESNIDITLKRLNIAFDMGHDTQIPTISRTGLILVSLLLGLDILILFPLAAYAAGVPRWTSTLDSFAMMRMGAAVADELPLLIGRDTDKIDALDELPGCIGDQAEEGDVVGKLGLRATRPLALRKNRRFECYGRQ
jgi:hypothetical protein